ncbi:hypothetical protein EVAR_10025_1 [Eumeta japonica]|uniref:Uncharacterized protein n=1 Tax=Eumeta variegata TaxID=151549 RepID=A0A4C1TRB9_EUMVA|nr:hypothetical protein EVAR_10025_1 [Eumeta japonica]
MTARETIHSDSGGVLTTEWDFNENLLLPRCKARRRSEKDSVRSDVRHYRGSRSPPPVHEPGMYRRRDSGTEE